MTTTTLRLSPELETDLKQLAKAHKRSAHGEMLYALQSYVTQQKSQEIEQIVTFWLSQMWGSEDFGRVTAPNLYNVIQEYSTHPSKQFVTIEDCVEYMRRWAQEGTPQDLPQAELEIVEEE